MEKKALLQAGAKRYESTTSTARSTLRLSKKYILDVGVVFNTDLTSKPGLVTSAFICKPINTRMYKSVRIF
jgi:hypothetical protein